MLVDGLEVGALPRWAKGAGIEFLKGAASSIFPGRDASEVTTICTNDGKFDQVFLKAQQDMIDGSDLKDTRLYELLSGLDGHATGVALWYGEDYQDLEHVGDFGSFIDRVREGLSSPSVEAYVLYAGSSTPRP